MKGAMELTFGFKARDNLFLFIFKIRKFYRYCDRLWIMENLWIAKKSFQGL